MTWAEVSARQERNDLPYLAVTRFWDLDAADRREALEDAWTRSEWPEVQVEAEHWIPLLRMAALPHEPLAPGQVLYRGATHDRRLGMSWTTDPDRARWFAERFTDVPGTEPTQVWCTSDVEELVLARFDWRGEDEVLLDVTSLDLDRITALED